MSPITNFALGLDAKERTLVQFLDQRISERHDLIGKLSYGIPMYYRKTWVCYLNPLKKGGVELAFAKGYKLSNEQGLLRMKKRKYVAGIDLFEITDVPEKAIDEIIQEAIILDDLFKR